jgi:hypothetical protein
MSEIPPGWAKLFGFRESLATAHALTGLLEWRLTDVMADPGTLLGMETGEDQKAFLRVHVKDYERFVELVETMDGTTSNELDFIVGQWVYGPVWWKVTVTDDLGYLRAWVQAFSTELGGPEKAVAKFLAVHKSAGFNVVPETVPFSGRIAV